MQLQAAVATVSKRLGSRVGDLRILELDLLQVVAFVREVLDSRVGDTYAVVQTDVLQVTAQVSQLCNTSVGNVRVGKLNLGEEDAIFSERGSPRVGDLLAIAVESPLVRVRLRPLDHRVVVVGDVDEGGV